MKDLTGVNVVVFMGRLNELAWVSLYSDGLTDDDLAVLGVARAHLDPVGAEYYTGQARPGRQSPGHDTWRRVVPRAA